MNLHEECLLKYLLNPMDLFNTTELLKLNNTLIQEGNLTAKSLVKPNKLQCSTGSI